MSRSAISEGGRAAKDGQVMRISELAERSGVPVATIKYYLRERLLHEGELTSATQARYDSSHLDRLRLIRALIGPAGLSIAQVRTVLDRIDHPPDSVHELLGIGAGAVTRAAVAEPHEHVHELMRSWGWRVDDKDCAAHIALAEALRGMDAAGFEMPEGALEEYRRHIEAIAEMELASVPTESPEAAVRYVVLGTVLLEPVLLALRRMAQQEASARRFEPDLLYSVCCGSTPVAGGALCRKRTCT
jgi:DNA-binding transcriptional MerR regulator